MGKFNFGSDKILKISLFAFIIVSMILLFDMARSDEKWIDTVNADTVAIDTIEVDSIYTDTIK